MKISGNLASLGEYHVFQWSKKSAFEFFEGYTVHPRHKARSDRYIQPIQNTYCLVEPLGLERRDVIEFVHQDSLKWQTERRFVQGYQ